jgi:hypothetical protein
MVSEGIPQLGLGLTNGQVRQDECASLGEGGVPPDTLRDLESSRGNKTSPDTRSGTRVLYVPKWARQSRAARIQGPSPIYLSQHKRAEPQRSKP